MLESKQLTLPQCVSSLHSACIRAFIHFSTTRHGDRCHSIVQSDFIDNRSLGSERVQIQGLTLPSP